MIRENLETIISFLLDKGYSFVLNYSKKAKFPKPWHCSISIDKAINSAEEYHAHGYGEDANKAVENALIELNIGSKE